MLFNTRKPAPDTVERFCPSPPLPALGLQGLFWASWGCSGAPGAVLGLLGLFWASWGCSGPPGAILASWGCPVLWGYSGLLSASCSLPAPSGGSLR